jgi:hypothetical protein
MYFIDFDDLVESNLPPDKREIQTVSFMRALVAPIANLYTQTTQTYKTQSSAPQWMVGSYSIDSVVKYGKVVFQATKDTTTEPTTSTDWIVVSENFLGVDNRLKINGTKVVLERALNQWFGQVDGVIYIGLNTVEAPVFISGFTETESSVVFTDTSSELVINSFTFQSQFNCTIYLPVALLASIGNENIIRNFVDKYIASGITYNIQTY